MKILYACSKSKDSILNYLAFKKYCPHDLYLAAWDNPIYTKIDWTLNPVYSNNKRDSIKLHELFEYTGIPSLDYKNTLKFANDIEKENIDLIICDGDIATYHIANYLHIKTISYSNLSLYRGLVWPRGLYTKARRYESLVKYYDKLPKYEHYVPSFLSFVKDVKLKDNYKFISPYFNLIENENEIIICTISDKEKKDKVSRMLEFLGEDFIFSTILDDNYLDNLNYCSSIICEGDTQSITDGLINSKNIIIFPDINDPILYLNTILCQHYSLASNLGSLDLAEKKLVDALEEALNEEPDSLDLEEEYTFLDEII